MCVPGGTAVASAAEPGAVSADLPAHNLPSSGTPTVHNQVEKRRLINKLPCVWMCKGVKQSVLWKHFESSSNKNKV